ncbi:MAG: flagellar basal body rod C-terminal domain-containing protein [Phycisphaerae bacterium]|nr:flagellar basal body rod C-terminal domain-containing protein [Phycisphaerae bacterium]
MSGLLDVSVSALVAQRTRLDAIAANLASADIGGNPNGPVKPPSIREVLFATGDPANNSELGVHVADIREVRAFIPRYEPLNPYADADGRVWYPDINPVEQQVNMMLAARSYEANIAAIEATKSMTNSAMEILS